MSRLASSDFSGTDLTVAMGPVALAEAFDVWATAGATSSRGLSEATEAVQRAMWTAFCAWCIHMRIDPVEVSADELKAYLRSREGSTSPSELTPRYSWRLVALVDRVVNFIAAKQGRSPNCAAAQLLEADFGLKHANAESKDPLPEVLTDAQDRALVAFLADSVPPTAAGGAVDLVSRWQDLRNRAGVALHRGAGLTPLEVRLLTVSSVFVDADVSKGAWKVRAPATGSVQAHDAPVARWARPLLAYWLALRKELEIPGEWLLPSTKSGKQWGKTAQFDSVAEVFQAAGLLGFKGGSYRLRNTFAVRQLERPQCTEAKVADWMGVDTREISRYRRVMVGSIDVK